jgi:uncharacterized iron-regulated membrane protein
LDNIALVNYPAKPNEAYRFTLYQNDGNINTYDLYHLNINPYDGKILRYVWNRDISSGFMHWVFQLHFSFHWGVPGLLLTAILGIVMMISVITGIIIYRKYLWKVFTFKVGINWKNKNTLFSSLHRMVGVWALLLNLAICFTGFWMNKFAFDPAYWKRQSIAASQNIIIQQNIDTLIARALRAQPMQHCYIRIPTKSAKPLVINGMLTEQPLLYGSELNSVKTDVINGNIISTTSYRDATAADKLEALSYPLHVGNYSSWPIKIIYVIVGLSPGFLSVSGFWLWRRKRIKQTINQLKTPL